MCYTYKLRINKSTRRMYVYVRVYYTCVHQYNNRYILSTTDGNKTYPYQVFMRIYTHEKKKFMRIYTHKYLVQILGTRRIHTKYSCVYTRMNTIYTHIYALYIRINTWYKYLVEDVSIPSIHAYIHA